jgi:hypothetical protein
MVETTETLLSAMRHPIDREFSWLASPGTKREGILRNVVADARAGNLQHNDPRVTELCREHGVEYVGRALQYRGAVDRP